MHEILDGYRAFRYFLFSSERREQKTKIVSPSIRFDSSNCFDFLCELLYYVFVFISCLRICLAQILESEEVSHLDVHFTLYFDAYPCNFLLYVGIAEHRRSISGYLSGVI